MKKILLVIGIFAAFFVTSCKKDTTVSDRDEGESGTDNPSGGDVTSGSLIPYFDLCESLIGTTVSQARNTLESKGWKYSYVDDDGSGYQEYCFTREDEEAESEWLTYIPIKNTDIVVNVGLEMQGWDNDSYLTKASVYSNLVKHIGKVHTMKSGTVFSFCDNHYYYDDFIANFSEIFERDFWSAMWDINGSFKKGGIMLYKYTYSFEMNLDDSYYYKYN